MTARKRAAKTPPMTVYTSLERKTVRRGEHDVVYELGNVRRRHRDAVGPNADANMSLVGFYVMAFGDGAVPSMREFDTASEARKLYNAATSVNFNPPLVTFSNPPRRRRRRNPEEGDDAQLDEYAANPPRKGSKRVEKLSDRVCHIEYYHAAGGKRDRPYRHEFKAGVCMELLTDGSVRIYSKSGKPLYKWFD